jgi:hypothetical protein
LLAPLRRALMMSGMFLTNPGGVRKAERGLGLS